MQGKAMTTSLEMMIGGLIEKANELGRSMDKAETSRKGMYEALEEIRDGMAELNHRVQTVEKQMSDAQPTIAQFVTVKNQVKAAGTVGKWLWLIGGFLIGSAAWIKFGAAWVASKLWGG